MDLLYRPVDGLGRKDLLLSDDRLITLLSVSYFMGPHVANGSVWLNAEPYSNLLQNLDLLRRLEGQGDLRPRRRELFDSDTLTFGSSDDLEYWERNEVTLKTQFGKEAFDRHRFLLLRDHQRTFLAQGDSLLNRFLLALPSWWAKPKDEFGLRLAEIYSHQKDQLLSSPISFQFGAAPRRSGDSDKFKTDVVAALNHLKERFPRLFPLRVPASLTLLFVPPRMGPGSSRADLDNLARKIVPHVH
ncbi:MAG TPA: hypothetical protein VHO25_19535, partial [Polyangiaceae bacterium]|nr:hypothetical protein [Polyangiaceae bacterium]